MKNTLKTGEEFGVLQAIKNKVDKIIPAASNNLAMLDSQGNLRDSGVSAQSFDGAGSVTSHNASSTAHSSLFNSKANKCFALTGTLLASGWSTTAPYSQVITINGVTADTNGVIGVADTATRSQYEVAAAANLRKIAQGANTITVMAYGEKPTINIPIEIIVLG